MYNFGTIVLVPFPFTDLSSAKLRPALIISKGNAYHEDVAVLFITSIKPDNADYFFIDSTFSYFKSTGLKQKSYIRCDKVATLEKSVVLGELGVLPKKIMPKIGKIFYSTFGF